MSVLRPALLRHGLRLQCLVVVSVLLAGVSSAVSVRSRPSPDAALGRDVPVAQVTYTVAPPVAITVPALGITDVRLVGLRKDREGRLQAPALASTPGWYSQGPAPGDDGSAVIAGHVDDYRRPGVFLRLSELRSGDRVDVRRSDGTVAAFAVSRVERHDKRTFPTEQVYSGSAPALRLITCGGAFDRRTRSYVDNVVVFAEPVAAA